MKKILILALALTALTSRAQQQGQTTAQQMIDAGLVCLADVCPDVQVRLMLSEPHGLFSTRFHTDLQTAYLHPQAALALKKAQATLKRTHPNLSLLVLDAARPMKVQGQLYAKVVGTQQNIYISDPRSGGDQHNYGLAVDVTLVDVETGEQLDMGTAFGTFEEASGMAAEEREGSELSETVIANRKLLRRAMAAGGYKPLRTEWWHFNFRTRSEAKANFRVIK